MKNRVYIIHNQGAPLACWCIYFLLAILCPSVWSTGQHLSRYSERAVVSGADDIKGIAVDLLAFNGKSRGEIPRHTVPYRANINSSSLPLVFLAGP